VYRAAAGQPLDVEQIADGVRAHRLPAANDRCLVARGEAVAALVEGVVIHRARRPVERVEIHAAVGDDWAGQVGVAAELVHHGQVASLDAVVAVQIVTRVSLDAQHRVVIRPEAASLLGQFQHLDPTGAQGGVLAPLAGKGDRFVVGRLSALQVHLKIALALPRQRHTHHHDHDHQRDQDRQADRHVGRDALAPFGVRFGQDAVEQRREPVGDEQQPGQDGAHPIAQALAQPVAGALDGRGAAGLRRLGDLAGGF